ncbi:MAG: DUF5678 domain-containing protein [Nitrospirota bacterium]
MTSETYIQLQEKYGGNFIARVEDQVVATGTTSKEMIEEVTRKNVDQSNLVFEYIEPKGTICVY